MPITATSTPRATSSSAQTLKAVRKIHLYFGVFIAPMLLFFAFTGAIQTLGLHEAAADYKAPNLLSSLGQIHKKQTYLLPEGRKPAPESVTQPAGSPENQHRGNGSADTQSPAPSLANASPATAMQPASSATPGSRSRQEPTLAKKQKEHLPLKIFFVLVSLGLFVSTLTGIYMAYKYDRNPLLITALLIAGALTPIILVSF